MPLRPAELCGEKSLDQFPGQRVTHNLPSEANHVQILAYANAAPTPKITKNTNTANALFCFMSIVSVD